MPDAPPPPGNPPLAPMPGGAFDSWTGLVPGAVVCGWTVRTLPEASSSDRTLARSTARLFWTWYSKSRGFSSPLPRSSRSIQRRASSS
jgi:hypothetical protein